MQEFMKDKTKEQVLNETIADLRNEVKALAEMIRSIQKAAVKPTK